MDRRSNSVDAASSRVATDRIAAWHAQRGWKRASTFGSRSGQAMAEFLVGLVGIMLLVVGLQQASLVSRKSFKAYSAVREDVAMQLTESMERYSGEFLFADTVDAGNDRKNYTGDDRIVVGDNSFYTEGNGFLERVGYPGADEIGDRLNEYDRIDPYSDLADTSDSDLSQKFRMHYAVDIQPVEILPFLRKVLGKDTVNLRREIFMPSWDGLMEQQ
ncbi:MAG: hypothetical protein U9P12_05545 [Verrucomicrobiota bacterium]|nr:hypothetical protein [Verrucomicrobiota bacterium]